MWETVRPSSNSIILSLNYHDFASIEVDKKYSSKGNIFYEIRIHIENVTEQLLDIYKLEDVTHILEETKEYIEDLYEDIIEMSNADVQEWLDDFIDVLNDY